MYRLAVCDDEPAFLKNHEALASSVLREAGIAHEITTYLRAQDLACRLLEQPGCFDALMLDILLDRENGMELARTLRGGGFRGGILFATSSKDFLLEGYSVYPVHYLLKPIERGALKEALLRDYHQRFHPPALSIPIRGGCTVVPLDAILYIESFLHAVVIHTKDRDIEAAIPLKEIRDLLPPGAFLQCHKSFIIPMSKIRNITRVEVTLSAGQRLPVGRVFYAEAITAFIEYMEGK